MIEEKIKERKSELENFEKERLERVKEEELKKAYREKMEQTDETADLGEINLSFFKRINRPTQFLIGCGLIAIIFSGLYLGMIALNKKQTKLNKKKKN